jgi:hypothetical protein
MNDHLDFDPMQTIRRATAGWRTILTIASLFALLGLGFSSLLPPVYQASSVLQVDIDYTRAAPLDDVTVMKAYERVRGVLLSDDVLSSALAHVEEELGGGGDLLDIAAVRARIRVSQRQDGWELLVYSRDPELAAAFANSWSESSLAALEEGLKHSLEAWEWQAALYSAHCTLETVPGDEAHAWWSCSTASEGLTPESISEAILEQVQLSRGILPIFSFSSLQRSDPPAAPILWRRGTLIIAGSLIGLVLGCIWVLGKPEETFR